MISIRHPQLEKLAQRHLEAIKEYHFRKSTKIVTSESWKKVDDWIKNNIAGYDFEKIILAKPYELRNIKSKFNNGFIFPDEVHNLNNLYERFSKQNTKFKNILHKDKPYNALQMIEDLGIEVCPYCNRNYIYNIKLDKTGKYKRTCEIDHFYPKLTYPIFAVSFYNLIPCCKTCNQTFKGDKEISKNPYELSENEYFFKLRIKDTTFYHRTEGFSIDCTQLKYYLEHNCEVFQLEKLYNSHKNLVLEMIQKRHVYSDDYIDELFRQYEGTLFSTRDDVLRHVLGSYINNTDFHTRPLSKLTRDIAQELGLI